MVDLPPDPATYAMRFWSGHHEGTETFSALAILEGFEPSAPITYRVRCWSSNMTNASRSPSGDQATCQARPGPGNGIPTKSEPAGSSVLKASPVVMAIRPFSRGVIGQGETAGRVPSSPRNTCESP